jgi:hypothetical protein
LHGHQRCLSKQSSRTNQQHTELVPLRTEPEDLRAGSGTATMAAYVVGEQEAFYRGRELVVPAH